MAVTHKFRRQQMGHLAQVSENKKIALYLQQFAGKCLSAAQFKTLGTFGEDISSHLLRI